MKSEEHNMILLSFVMIETQYEREDGWMNKKAKKTHSTRQDLRHKLCRLITIMCVKKCCNGPVCAKA